MPSTFRIASVHVIGLLLALAACAPSPLPPETLGHWHGTAHQVFADGTYTDYPMTLVVQGAKPIAIDYPTLGCSSTLTPETTSNGRAEFTEHLTSGSDRCIEGGHILLVPHAQTLGWSWNTHDNADGHMFATATLRRKP